MATKELQAIIAAREAARQAHRPAALVTVFKTTGSTYRRPGARMLVLAGPTGPGFGNTGGDFLGSISGGCLEDDARERAVAALATGRAVAVRYDTTAEADIVFGSGVGCQGVVQGLVQPLPAEDTESDPLAYLARALRERRSAAMASVCAVTAADPALVGAFLFVEENARFYSGTLSALDSALANAVAVDARRILPLGRSALHTYPVPGGGSVEVFLEAIAPPRSLLICGAGQDAVPLARLGKELGWRVRVVDGRRAYATRARFPEADEVTVCPAHDFTARLTIEPGEATVLMTHNYLHDKVFLRALLASDAGYIGVLGPRRRTERLLAELADLPGIGSSLGKRSRRRVHGPAGLDIGAEAPEQIALSIVAEIEAVYARRRGGALKHRRAPLHEAAGSGRTRMLAAG